MIVTREVFEWGITDVSSMEFVMATSRIKRVGLRKTNDKIYTTCCKMKTFSVVEDFQKKKNLVEIPQRFSERTSQEMLIKSQQNFEILGGFFKEFEEF